MFFDRILLLPFKYEPILDNMQAILFYDTVLGLSLMCAIQESRLPSRVLFYLITLRYRKVFRHPA